MRRINGPGKIDLLAVVATLALVACADEATGPQFANEPAPTRPATERPIIATPVAPPTATAVATPASIAALLAPRGAPSRVYFIANDAVWTASSSGSVTRIMGSPHDGQIVAVDPSPDASHVAVLLRAQSGSADVVILDEHGQETARLRGLRAPTGTPTPANDNPPDAIDWSPQGDRLLVSFQHDGMVSIDVEGNHAVAPLGPTEGVVTAPAWSPTGESVAYIAESSASQGRTLRLLNVSGGSSAEVAAPLEGGFIVDFAWMPDGVSLLFTEGGQRGGAVTGVDLWRVNADGSGRALIASAGTVAPVARITKERPSPDGQSVAYIALVPGQIEPQVDSLWVRDLASRAGFRVDLPSVRAVDRLWWTDRGLLVLTTTQSAAAHPGTAQLLRVDRDGTVETLWTAPIPRGTPVAGTPVVGTPVATPIDG
jgi:Tol biopolymer transport system component